MVAGQRATFEGGSETGTATTSDFVFLIERKSTCPRDYYKDQISEIPGLVAREVSGDARFAVVGFGGAGNLAVPHMVTSGNRIFSTAEHTTTTLKT